jgi:outer membrane protein assembly factor BamB
VARKAAPVIAHGHVYHASESGFLHALDEEDGSVAWATCVARHNPKGCWSTPLVTDEAVFIGSYDGAVFKLGLSDGAVIWRFDGADWVGSSPCLNEAGDLLYIGLEYALDEGCGAIACLSSATGEPVWTHPIPALVHASPLFLPPGDVVCGGNDGKLRCLDARSGSLVWEATVNGDVKSKAAVGPRGERLFVGSCDGGLYAIDRRNGDIVWRYQSRGPIFSIPYLDGAVYKIAADSGKLAAKRALGGKLFASPVPDADEILLGSTTGKLSRLSVSDLSIVSQHQFFERITSEVAVSPRGLYVPTFDGQLTALEINQSD